MPGDANCVAALFLPARVGRERAGAAGGALSHGAQGRPRQLWGERAAEHCG